MANNIDIRLDQTAARPSLDSEIIRIIRGNEAPRVLRERLEDYHGSDIAEVISLLSVPGGTVPHGDGLS